MATAAKPVQPVRMYAEDDARLPRTVKAAIHKHRQALISGLLDSGAKDFAEYRHYVGQIAALQTAIDVCDQAEKDLSGE